MKNPLLPVTLGLFSFGLAAQPLSAQSSFAPSGAGNSPFSRVYAAPSNPPSEAPTPSMQAMPGGYAAAAMNPAGGAGYYNEPIDPNHKLNRGDRLSFRVVEDRDVKPPDPLVVTDSGEI